MGAIYVCQKCGHVHHFDGGTCPVCGFRHISIGEQSNLSCRLGFHSWFFCTCKRCGRQRLGPHNIPPLGGCQCLICHKTFHDYGPRHAKCRRCGHSSLSEVGL